LDIEDGVTPGCHAGRSFRNDGNVLLDSPRKSPDDFEEGGLRKPAAKHSKKNLPSILKLTDGLKEIGKR